MKKQKKLLDGFIDFCVNKKTKNLIPYVIYIQPHGTTKFAVDKRQVIAAANRFKVGDRVKFYSEIPFVAVIDGIKFEKEFFEFFYDESYF